MESAAQGSQRQRFWLRFSDHDVELPQGETLIGRSERCQIVVDDPLVSRRHAVFIVEPDGVSLQDLGSVNGVLVNGVRLKGTIPLSSGDKIGLGRQEIEMYSAEASARVRSPSDRKRLAARTLSGISTQEGDSEATRQGNALDMLGGVADKVLA
jgi:pSer/pThr/pTyr-binding forkhead associated (FHA) protein